MISGLVTPPDPAAPHLIHPVTTNPAVALCCEAYARTRKSTRGKGLVFSTLDAEGAYRSAMPPLHGRENIRDFVACTAHAMLIGALSGPDAARLLYAAQVAGQLVDKSRPIGRPLLQGPIDTSSTMDCQVVLNAPRNPSE